MNPTPAVVNTRKQNLALRTNATASSSLVLNIPIGSTVTVNDILSPDGKGDTWANVTYNGATGFARKHLHGLSYDYLVLSETPKSENAEQTSVDTKEKYDEPTVTVNGLDKTLEAMINNVSGTNGLFKGTLRLFGSPFQYTNVVDYRVSNVSDVLGRTYLENIAVEAPVCTIIPGKPEFLPNAKDKQGTGRKLLNQANSSFNSINRTKVDDEGLLRYFDFASDYLEYIKYVNVLCRTSAGFLEISDVELMGVPLGSFDWAAYRFDTAKYRSSIALLTDTIKDTAGVGIDTVKKGINDLLGITKKSDGEILMGDKGNSSNMQNSIESATVNMNFVQFYVNPQTGKNENASNSTTESAIFSKLEGLSDMSKELAFLANSGGFAATDIKEGMGDSINNIAAKMPGNGSLSGFFSRILNLGGTLITGDNLIVPEIFQRSDYSESYQLVVDLKSPYMDTMSYYLNIVVPLMHLMALVLPKQSTANTYASPFLIRAFVPGVFNTNMGIVESLNIERSRSGDSWSVDGFPAEMTVTMNIKDLYSGLSMSPSTNPTLFISNSSLIDYLAVTAGLNITHPMFDKKMTMLIESMFKSITDIPQNAAGYITESIHHGLEQFYTLHW